jgi:hypothetical protein
VGSRTQPGAREAAAERRDADPDDPCQAAGIGEHHELPLEGLPRPPQEGVDGRDRDPFNLGDALCRPLCALPQAQDALVAVGQVGEGLRRHREVDLAQELCIDVLAVDLDGMMGHLVHRDDPGAAPQHVGADVAGDHRQPRVEAAVPAELRQRPPGSREGLLYGLLGIVVGVQSAQAEPQKPSVVSLVEFRERAFVAHLAPLHELAVAG